jgi:Putative peptidoglycan binding domain
MTTFEQWEVPRSIERAEEQSVSASQGEGGEARSLLKRGSRGAPVARTQTLLNRFLAGIVNGPQQCVDRSPRRVDEIRRHVFALRRNRQLPLVVDGRFGPNTEHATTLFQACAGLVRDGKVGPVTWQSLERYGSKRPTNPPDTAGCGVPDRPSTQLEQELDLERELLNEAPRRRPAAVRARLSLFQNASTTSHRNHFQCQASRVARLLGAYADPRAERCSPRRVGPTAYDTGADIIGAITSAHACLRRRLTTVHIFAHSGSYGVFGSTAGSNGLYVTANPGDRPTGARSIVDIPVSALANDVVVVLHGCNQANGSDSFAEELYRHLAATLSSPTVFAHPNSGCAGRDNSWRRFDSRSPAGRSVRSIAPHYSGRGCCSP